MRSHEDPQGIEVVRVEGLERSQPELEPHRGSIISNPCTQVESMYTEPKTKATSVRDTKIAWKSLIPSPGLARWIYALVLAALLAAIIALGVVNSRHSKPFYNQLFPTIPMPAPSNASILDPYNTTGRYMTYRGQDFKGNDIVGTIAYSIEQCIAACDTYNQFAAKSNGTAAACLAGTLNYNQQDSVDGQNANCFLKYAVARDVDETNREALGFRLCANEGCAFNGTG